MANRSLLKKTLLSALLFPLCSSSFSFIPTSASSSFPECGLTCTILETAQSGCVPPAAETTNDQTYISCFCQSSYLTGLKTSGALCTSCTSASDQELLVDWYNGYCNGGYTSTLTATATATGAATTTAAAATTTAAAATSTSTSVSTSSKSSGSDGKKSWFSTHWRWVVMVIVLVVGFGALAIIGTWYKKRHDARQPNLYHGSDRNNTGNIPGNRGGPAAAGFFSGSLRNFSRSNVNSTNNPSTANNSINNVVVGSKAARMQQQPSMSTTSFSNPRSSIVNNNINDINNNNFNNTNQMWGPHQATAHTRDFNDITPVDGTAFRNTMAAAAAAAALEKGGTTSSITNNGSRTDTSSIGGGAGAGRATTPRSNNNNNNNPNPNRLSKLSVQSSSTLQKQTSSNTLRRGPTPIRQHSASPVSPISDD